MRILFLTNLLPYPLDNGGKIKTYTTLKSLSSNGHVIDLVCFREQISEDTDSTYELKKICNSVTTIYQKLTTAENKKYMMVMATKSLLSKYSFGTYKYLSNEMKSVIKNLFEENTYDCAYFDHLQLCVYQKYILQLSPNIRMLLDEHNCETLIMKRNKKSSSNILKKFFLTLEAFKLQKFEIKSIMNADNTIVLSKEDYRELCKETRKNFAHSVIPIGIEDSDFIKEIREIDKIPKILFIGTLTWAPNNEGIIWYLKKVVPLLESKMKFQLYIVGKNPSEEVKRLTEGKENITVTGYVDSVDLYYEICDYMIVPLLSGSGQRVKIIEAFSKGMPVISTKIGAEGLEYKDGKSIFIADTPEEFVEKSEKIIELTTRKVLSENSKDVFERNYSIRAVSKKINEATVGK